MIFLLPALSAAQFYGLHLALRRAGRVLFSHPGALPWPPLKKKFHSKRENHAVGVCESRQSQAVPHKFFNEHVRHRRVEPSGRAHQSRVFVRIIHEIVWLVCDTLQSQPQSGRRDWQYSEYGQIFERVVRIERKGVDQAHRILPADVGLRIDAGQLVRRHEDHFYGRLSGKKAQNKPENHPRKWNVQAQEQLWYLLADENGGP